MTRTFNTRQRRRGEAPPGGISVCVFYLQVHHNKSTTHRRLTRGGFGGREGGSGLREGARGGGGDRSRFKPNQTKLITVPQQHSCTYM